MGWVVLPGEVGEFGATGLVGEGGEVVEEVVGEFAPGQLAQKGFSFGWGGVPNLGGCDLSHMEVGGEARGGLFGGEIPFHWIGREMVFKKVLEFFVSGLFAHF